MATCFSMEISMLGHTNHALAVILIAAGKHFNHKVLWQINQWKSPFLMFARTDKKRREKKRKQEGKEPQNISF